MVDEEEINEEEQGQKKKSGSSTVKIIIITVILSLLIGGGLVAGTYYFVSGMNADEKSSAKKDKKVDEEEAEDDEADEDEDEEGDEEDAEEVDEDDDEEESSESNKDKPAQYLPMDPKFVVSFHDQKTARFMQFEIEVMSRDKKTFEVIGLHSAAIRSSLLMLFGSQNSEVMSTREGKQMLLDETVKDINTTLVRITGKKSFKSAVEAAYFNSFVIQ